MGFICTSKFPWACARLARRERGLSSNGAGVTRSSDGLDAATLTRAKGVSSLSLIEPRVQQGAWGGGTSAQGWVRGVGVALAPRWGTQGEDASGLRPALYSGKSLVWLVAQDGLRPTPYWGCEQEPGSHGASPHPRTCYFSLPRADTAGMAISAPMKPAPVCRPYLGAKAAGPLAQDPHATNTGSCHGPSCRGPAGVCCRREQLLATLGEWLPGQRGCPPGHRRGYHSLT